MKKGKDDISGPNQDQKREKTEKNRRKKNRKKREKNKTLTSPLYRIHSGRSITRQSRGDSGTSHIFLGEKGKRDQGLQRCRELSRACATISTVLCWLNTLLRDLQMLGPASPALDTCPGAVVTAPSSAPITLCTHICQHRSTAN